MLLSSSKTSLFFASFLGQLISSLFIFSAFAILGRVGFSLITIFNTFSFSSCDILHNLSEIFLVFCKSFKKLNNSAEPDFLMLLFSLGYIEHLPIVLSHNVLFSSSFFVYSWVSGSNSHKPYLDPLPGPVEKSRIVVNNSLNLFLTLSLIFWLDKKTSISFNHSLLLT